jgi:hypothetical protein
VLHIEIYTEAAFILYLNSERDDCHFVAYWQQNTANVGVLDGSVH